MLPLLQARIASIWAILAEFVANAVIVRADYDAFKLKVTLTDGSTLRISEQYHHGILEQYAYYWLDASDQLRIGWDNAPHHHDLANFPYHKHVGSQDNRQTAAEITPNEILAAIKASLS